MPVMGASTFAGFFSAAADLDLDRNDLKRCGDFVEAGPGGCPCRSRRTTSDS